MLFCCQHGIMGAATVVTFLLATLISAQDMPTRGRRSGGGHAAATHCASLFIRAEYSNAISLIENIKLQRWPIFILSLESSDTRRHFI